MGAEQLLDHRLPRLKVHGDKALMLFTCLARLHINFYKLVFKRQPFYFEPSARENCFLYIEFLEARDFDKFLHISCINILSVNIIKV
jgi:hypothetical protein